LLAIALALGVQTVAIWHPRAAQATGVANAWTTDRSVAYQNDIAHTGSQANDSLLPPLIKKWSYPFTGPVSYPLIAEGKMFVTVADSANGTTLYGFDQTTGAKLWAVPLPGTYHWSNAAYDNGQVFAVNFDGQLSAFNATTGLQTWSVKLPIQYFFSSAPTAFGGIVFISGSGTGGTLYAVNETDGSVMWTDGAASGQDSSPAVSTTGVYASYACNWAYDFAPRTGAQIWLHSGSCSSGGGGKTAVLSGGKLYTRDSGGDLVLDAQSGNQLATYNAIPAPAVWGSTIYTLSGLTLPTLTAQGAHSWTFTGDGTLDTAPVVINGVVYVAGSGGNLYALDAATGLQIGSTMVVGAGVVAPDEQGVFQPLTGLGAGLGWLDVPAGNLLVAYASALNISPGDVVFGAQATGVPTSSWPVTITNYSTGPDSISGLATSGDFSETDNCSSPLATGASCTVNVVFTPSTGGVRTGNLTFTDSVVGAHTVPLSGNQANGFPPGSPANLTAIPGLSSVHLSWSPPPFTGGSPVTGYVVTRTPGGTTNLGPSATSLSVGGLTAGVSYSFQLSAVNGNGTGTSATVTALVRFGTPGQILTVAGSVGSGSAHSVGQLPYSLAVAGTHVYIGDFANPVVRDLDTTSGQETVLAGNDGYGFTGDGGPAIAAGIEGAGAIANCGPGFTFFADTYNYVIRRIDGSGNISTVAGTGRSGYSGDGGPATSAQLSRVFGLACRTGGGLYISDSDNGAVRILYPNGLIGPWWSGFSFPTGVIELGSTDVANVSDAGADNVVWNLVGNSACVEAGQAPSQFQCGGSAAMPTTLVDPRGLAFTGGLLYVADRGNNRVIPVNPATGAVSIAWNMNQPSDLSVDSSNHLYVANGGAFLVEKIDLATTQVTDVAGNRTPSWSGDGGQSTAAQLGNPYAIAVDAAGNKYIADDQNSAIRKISPNGVITTVAGDGYSRYSGDGGLAIYAELNDTRGVVLDAAGNIYISDAGNQRIRKVDHSSGIITTIAGGNGAGYSGDNGPAIQAQINFPSQVAVDNAGNLYIADTANQRVRKVDGFGNIITVAGNGTAGYSGDGGPATAALLNRPLGLALDSANNLFISDSKNNVVRRVDHSTGYITTVAGNGTAGLGGDGHAATMAMLNGPFGLAFDGSGNLYIADTLNERIRVVGTNGSIASVVGGCGIAAGFAGDGGQASMAQMYFPFGIAVDASGDLLIADVNNNRVRGVNGAGGLRASACPGATGAPQPRTGPNPASGIPPMRIVQSGAGAHVDLGDRPISAARQAAPKPASRPNVAKPVTAPAIVAPSAVVAHAPRTRDVHSRQPDVVAGTVMTKESTQTAFNRYWPAAALMTLAAVGLALLRVRKRNRRVRHVIKRI
jgi:outer membrane protein assembly factor BamB/sugar lactone lactonase YvrE